MILVISNWKKKALYLICAAVLILAFALVFSSGGQEPASVPPAEEQPTGSDFDGRVEKVTKDKNVQNNESALEELEKDKEGEEKSQSKENKETLEDESYDEQKSEGNPEDKSENNIEEEKLQEIKEEKEEGWLKSLIQKFRAEE
ncbi:MAG: hypothetical protein PWQ96_320 [Clostridia bacterium]|jgi:hypothetical protein|nr:hypothetical protein [Clostridia bacterium]